MHYTCVCKYYKNAERPVFFKWTGSPVQQYWTVQNSTMWSLIYCFHKNMHHLLSETGHYISTVAHRASFSQHCMAAVFYSIVTNLIHEQIYYARTNETSIHHPGSPFTSSSSIKRWSTAVFYVDLCERVTTFSPQECHYSFADIRLVQNSGKLPQKLIDE